MKDIFKAVGISALAFAATGCTNDITLDNDSRHEEYVKNFIEAFGIPDPDHNYAMARSAGLHVTTKKGGHVTVTAEVRGKEYLFADLDVTPGTHALPVTIPASVSTLNVKTNKGVHVVATDATVDIDAAPTGTMSRTYYTVHDENNDMTMELLETGQGGDPYLVFDAASFNGLFKQMDKFFKSGEENTITEIPQITNGSVNGQPVSYFKDSSHETSLTCKGGEFDYYIFPIYWKKNSTTKKQDYQVYIHKVREGEDELHSPIRLEFGEPGKTTATNPFPEIGWCNYAGVGSINPINKTYVRNKIVGTEVVPTTENFVFGGAGLGQAYNRSTAKVILTRGKRIHMKRYTDADKNHYFPSFALAIKSNITGDNFSFVSSAPFYNAQFWNGNYYDVPLDRLYQATSGTKRVALERRPDEENKPVPISIYDPDLDISPGGYYANGGEWWKIHKDYVFDYTTYFLSYQLPDNPFLLGFCSPATSEGDNSTRSYDEVIFLVTPHVSPEGLSTRVQFAPIPEPIEWTIAAEDLGGSDDWDFNDVVFSFTDVIRNLKTANYLKNVAVVSGPGGAQSVRVVTVTPKAAGGTLPVYITYTGKNIKPMPEMPSEGSMMFSEANRNLKAYLEDESNSREGVFILGTELHKWLGAADCTQFVNVGNSRRNVNAPSVQFVIPTSYDVGDEKYFDYAAGPAKENIPLYGFAILIDKDNELDIDTFNDTDKGFCQVDVTLGEGTYFIGAPSDDQNVKVPQMIMVEGDWEWPSERTNIMTAYANFKDWIKDQSNIDWIMNPDPEKVTKK